jgi:O-antigen ligase
VGSTDDKGRPLTGSSGRTQAWRGALRQAADRPVAGYGFGTEPDVFVDRYVGFNSGVPENSYVGLALQLGALGLAAFAALCALLLVPALRALRGLDATRRGLTAAAAGGLVGGLGLAFFQSYVYAAGNNATAALWICAFLLPATAHGARQRR